MPLSRYGSHLALDAIFGSGSPTSVFLALVTTKPTRTDDGDALEEPSGNAYARVEVTNNATNFPAASSDAKTTGTDITFPTPTGSWGVVTYVVACDASSSGNVLGFAKVTGKAITEGRTPWFQAGSLTFTLG